MNKLTKNINKMNIKQLKNKLNKEYNQAIVDKVLNSMWSKLGNELDEVMMSEGPYTETNDIMFTDQDHYMSIIVSTMMSQCD
mgnify:CR=1 FL=1|tara:strand:+ start:76 stop:321 length:246 start_codon:yes stop_codon:yes gene_type:complete